MHNSKKTFNFSKPYFESYLIENARNYSIKNKTVVLNLGENEVRIGDKPLAPLKSSIYANTEIGEAGRLACFELPEDYSGQRPFKYSGELVAKWSHVYEIFQLPRLKKTKLWRSQKEKAGNFELNLWFAPANTDCGLHNKHDFSEVHTQLYGLGRMQKFYANDARTLYGEVFMVPGFTHDPFYDVRGLYPWHRYFADTDCIWLAVEF